MMRVLKYSVWDIGLSRFSVYEGFEMVKPVVQEDGDSLACV